MGMKNLGAGDFKFPSSFGFTGSAAGTVNPRSHPSMEQDEFGDGTYLANKSAEPPALAAGGAVKPKMPKGAKGGTPKVAKAVLGALQLGQAIGQKKAAMGAGLPPGTPPGGPASVPAAMAGPPPPVGAGPMPGMRRGGKVKHMADGGATNNADYDGMPDAPVAPWNSEGHPLDAVMQRTTINRKTGERTEGPKEPMYDREPMVGYAKGGKFIQKGIKHPGRMKNLAKKHGVSVHQEMERDSHSSSKSLRSAANLGLRLTGGDLSPHKRKR